MKKTTFGVAAFAVFATTILLLSQVAQPVSIQAIDQQKDLDQLEKEAKAFKKELEPFAKALSEDTAVETLVEKLRSDTKIKELITDIQQTDVEDVEERNRLGQELCDYLEDETNTDAQELQTLLTEKYGGMFSKIEERQLDIIDDIDAGKISEETLIEKITQQMKEMAKNPDPEIDIGELINITIFVAGVAVVTLVIAAIIFAMGFCAAIGAIFLTVLVAAIIYIIYKIILTIVVVTGMIIAGIIGFILDTIELLRSFFGIHLSDIKDNAVAKNTDYLPKSILSINSNALLNAIFKMLARLRKTSQFA